MSYIDLTLPDSYGPHAFLGIAGEDESSSIV